MRRKKGRGTWGPGRKAVPGQAERFRARMLAWSFRQDQESNSLTRMLVGLASPLLLSRVSLVKDKDLLLRFQQKGHERWRTKPTCLFLPQKHQPTHLPHQQGLGGSCKTLSSFKIKFALDMSHVSNCLSFLIRGSSLAPLPSFLGNRSVV